MDDASNKNTNDFGSVSYYFRARQWTDFICRHTAWIIIILIHHIYADIHQRRRLRRRHGKCDFIEMKIEMFIMGSCARVSLCNQKIHTKNHTRSSASCFSFSLHRINNMIFFSAPTVCCVGFRPHNSSDFYVCVEHNLTSDSIFWQSAQTRPVYMYTRHAHFPQIANSLTQANRLPVCSQNG